MHFQGQDMGVDGSPSELDDGLQDFAAGSRRALEESQSQAVLGAAFKIVVADVVQMSIIDYEL